MAVGNPTEDLIAAKDRIVKDGWLQGDYFQVDNYGKLCGRCAMGAVYGYGPNDLGSVGSPVPAILVDHTDALRALRQATREADPTSRSIVQWNDKPRRTVDEVLAVFDRAIEISRG